MNLQSKESYLEFIVQSSCPNLANIFICGNILPLGQWNPKKAFKLFQNDKKRDIWKSLHPISIKLLQKIEFKLIKIDSQNNIQWQSLLQNRIYQNIYPEGKILKFKQGASDIEILSTNFKIISYRRKLLDILDDLQSQASQSCNFKSNYQIQSYFKQVQRQDKKIVSISKIIFKQEADTGIEGQINHILKDKINLDFQIQKLKFGNQTHASDYVIQSKSTSSQIKCSLFNSDTLSILGIETSHQAQQDWLQSWEKEVLSSNNRINSSKQSKGKIYYKVAKTVKQLRTKKKIL